MTFDVGLSAIVYAHADSWFPHVINGAVRAGDSKFDFHIIHLYLLAYK